MCSGEARNKKLLLGFGAISLLQKLSTTGFCLFLANAGARFPKFVLLLTNEGNWFISHFQKVYLLHQNLICVSPSIQAWLNATTTHKSVEPHAFTEEETVRKNLGSYVS